jgi:hypothetical protein
MDLVYEIPESLDAEFCKRCIKKFESDNRLQPGRTMLRIDKNIKDTTDLMIGRYKDWSEECEILDAQLQKGIDKFKKMLSELVTSDFSLDNISNMNHYQMQKSGKYEWHHDFAISHGSTRVLTFMWYLNVPDEGGETDFIYKKVKPETGKLVIFPATWEKFHRGCPAINKYIITGWLWMPIS